MNANKENPTEIILKYFVLTTLTVVNLSYLVLF